MVFGVRWPVDASPRSGPTFLWLLCVGVCGQVPSLCGRPLCRAAAAPLQCDLIAANRTSTTPVSDRAPLSRRGLGLQHVHFGEMLIHAPSWGALRVAHRTSWGPHPASLPLPAGLGGRPVLRLQDLCAGRPPPRSAPRFLLPPPLHVCPAAAWEARPAPPPRPERLPRPRSAPTPHASLQFPRSFYIVATRHTLRTIYHFYYF